MMSRAGYRKACHRWADVRWCWVDKSVIDEVVDDAWKQAKGEGVTAPPNPVALIDGEAEHYGLDDPTEAWGIYSGQDHLEEIAQLRQQIMERWQ